MDNHISTLKSEKPKNLAAALAKYDFGWRWGWAIDEALRERGDPHHHILYLELPTGQVSFHVGQRYAGPDFAGRWDGVKDVAADRICRFADRVFTGKPLRCPDCGADVPTVFEHVDGCPPDPRGG